MSYFKGKSLFLDLELVGSSEIEPRTTKPGNQGPRTIKTVRNTTLSTVASGFLGLFCDVASWGHMAVHVITPFHTARWDPLPPPFCLPLRPLAPPPAPSAAARSIAPPPAPSSAAAAARSHRHRGREGEGAVEEPSLQSTRAARSLAAALPAPASRTRTTGAITPPTEWAAVRAGGGGGGGGSGRRWRRREVAPSAWRRNAREARRRERAVAVAEGAGGGGGSGRRCERVAAQRCDGAGGGGGSGWLCERRERAAVRRKERA